MTPTPLIIDTDTAGDDCTALLEGLLDPAANLIGITVCAGNVGFEGQLRNAQLTVNATGRLGEVPVHPGAKQPLKKQWHSASEVFGDGVGGLRADMSEYPISEVPATEALVAASKAHEGELVIVCIAPLTNIALAIQADPAFATRVKRFYVMGGSNNARGNVTAAAEYNFYVDPEAAQILFESGANVTVVTWDPITLRDALFDEPKRDAIDALGTPLASFYKDVNRDALAFDLSVGVGGSTHPDSMTCAIALHPELALKVGKYNVAVECESELSRGYSAMSWSMPGQTRSVHGLELNADVVEQADNAAFFRYLSKLLSNTNKPTVPFTKAIDDKQSQGVQSERTTGYVQ